MIIFHVEDALLVNRTTFLQIEDRESKVFLWMPERPLQPKVIWFSGVELSAKENGLISMTKKEKIAKLEASRTKEWIKSQRALPQYIAGNCILGILSAVQLIAPGHQAIWDV